MKTTLKAYEMYLDKYISERNYNSRLIRRMKKLTDCDDEYTILTHEIEKSLERIKEIKTWLDEAEIV